MITWACHEQSKSILALSLSHVVSGVYITVGETYFKMSLSLRKISMFLSQVQGQKLTRNAQEKIMTCF